MPGPIPARSTSRLRRIFHEAKRERRRTGRPRRRKFYRDARQDRVKNISRKKETRSPARRFASRYLSPALHHGHVHAHPLRRSRAPRAAPGLHRLRQLDRRGDNVDLTLVDLAVSLMRAVCKNAQMPMLRVRDPFLAKRERCHQQTAKLKTTSTMGAEQP